MSDIFNKNKNLFKNLLIAVLIVGFVMMYWQLDGEKRLQLFALENSPMEAEEFLSVFEINSNEACKEKDKNKYKLPESECIAKIRRYSDQCKISAAQKFPGKVNTIEKMLLIGNSFKNCVFENKEN